jgi:transcriptional regulator with XRE-family HTH domain
MEIGSRLREIREGQHLTLEQVREEAGVSQPYLSKVETGRALPHPDTFERIAESIGVKRDELEVLLEHLLFQRDRTEFEKMAVPSEVAQLTAGLLRFESDAHGEALKAVREVLPEIDEFLTAAETGNGGDPTRGRAATAS